MFLCPSLGRMSRFGCNKILFKIMLVTQSTGAKGLQTDLCNTTSILVWQGLCTGRPHHGILDVSVRHEADIHAVVAKAQVAVIMTTMILLHRERFVQLAPVRQNGQLHNPLVSFGVCRVTGACFVGVCRVTGAFVGVCRVTGAHCGQFVCLPSLSTGFSRSSSNSRLVADVKKGKC